MIGKDRDELQKMLSEKEEESHLKSDEVNEL